MVVAAAAIVVLVLAVGVGIERAASSHPSATTRSTRPRPTRSPSTGRTTAPATGAPAPSSTPASVAESSSASDPAGGDALPPVRGDPSLPACRPEQLRFTTVTDKATYAPDDVVAVEFVAVNTSGDRCNGPSVCGVGAQADIDSADGTAVARLTSPAIACPDPAPLPPALDPGASSAYSVQQTWDHRSCDAFGQCASSPGTFRAVAAYQGQVAEPATFTVSG